MSLWLKTLYSMLTGALGALAAWFILDWLLKLQPEVYADAILNGTVVGICVGVAVNGFRGLLEFKGLPLIKGILVGFLVGIVGGNVGLLVGEVFYQNLGGSNALRIVGWAIFGITLGLTDGILAFSFKRIFYAGIGGLLGGLFGGAAFSFLASLSLFPYTSRALGFGVLGALIGLFIGLLPNVLKDAWVKVNSTGRNEGKECILDKARIVIGASEGCDLSLYGDSNVAPKHAEIVQDGKGYVLKPIGGTVVLVSGQQIRQYNLANEDTFQLGSQSLMFRRRNS